MSEKTPMIPLGLASPFTTGSTPPTNRNEHFGEGYRWANISDLGPKKISETANSITQAGFEAANFGPMAQPGDLLFSFKLSVGTVSIAAAPMLTNEAIATFPAGSMLDNRYAYYMLPIYLLRSANYNIYGAPLLNDSIMRRAKVPIPPLQTQRRIADYLDRETAEIDAMIDKLEELAETLRARRTDVIKRTIASDRSIAIGLMVDVTLGKMLQPAQKKPTDVQRPYLRAAHVQPGGVIDFDVDEKQMWFSETEVQALNLRAGDTVVVEGGAGFGRSAHLTEDLPGWGFQNSIIRLRGSAEDGRYLMYSLHAALSSGAIHVACNAATFAHFTAEKVEAFRVPFHEPAKRARIADHLDEVTSKIDAMLTKVAQLKDLLIERRAALITDVVTGRKDVA